MDILSFLPDDLKRELIDGLVDFLARQAERTAGDQIADGIRKLSSQAALFDSIDQAIETAVKRFAAEYNAIDEDLVAAITADASFWQSKSVYKALTTLIRHPGAWLPEAREIVAHHFEDVLPEIEQKFLAAAPILPALTRPRPYHNLPQPDYVRFVGREREMEWLRRRLAPVDRTWQIVIAGIGGVGKSALALAIAHEYREHYNELQPEDRFDAIIWISAKTEVLIITGPERAAPSGLTFRTLEDIYTTISQTLEREDITRALPEDQDRLVQRALSQQRTLLVVDNLESVADERVRSFLRNLPLPTKAIVTSREWVDVADVLKLTGLSWEETERMIAEEAAVRQVILDAAQQRRLFDLTSGLPLPIKLSVARLASGEIFEQVMRWLGDAPDALAEYCIQGQIDSAIQHNPYAWRLLLACSLFDRGAGASREALGCVVDLSLRDRDNGLTVLQRLSLINRTEADRFWLLPMVQGYAGVQLAHADFEEQFTERWLAWLLKFAQNYGVDLDLHAEQAPLMKTEYRNLLTSADWCFAHEQWQTATKLIEGVWFYLYLTGLFGDLRHYLGKGIDAASRSGEEREGGRFCHRLGILEWVQGQHRKAKQLFVTAEGIARKWGDEREIGHIWHNLSDIIARFDGDFEGAEQMARGIMEIGCRLNDLRLKVYGAYRLEEFREHCQDFVEAERWINSAAVWAEELGWQRALAWIAYRQGALALRKCSLDVAEAATLRSLELATSWGEGRLIAYDQLLLAAVYDASGDLDKAHTAAQKAHNLSSRLGITQGMIQELDGAEELLRRLLGKRL